MPRRISSGKVGRSVLGDIFTQDNALQSVVDNANIVLQPSGTGIVESDSDIQTNDQAGIRFADANSSNYVKLNGPSNITSNFTITLPDTAGSNGQALTTDSNGNLSFSAVAFPVSNRTAADGNTYFLAMVDEASKDSGSEDTLSISDGSRLQFVPNPGLLTVNSISTTSVSATSVDINGGAIDGTTIGANTRANGSFSSLTATSITEDSSITLKTNVHPITNGLQAILDLNGVTYDRKDGSKQNEAGLIAETVNEILPNIVTKDTLGNPSGINYTKLTAYLIEAVKELKKELDIVKGNK